MSDHKHKYYKETTRKGLFLFRCGLEKCSHFVHEGIIIGRESLCWRCGESFVITKQTTRNKYFHCFDCTKRKTVEESNVVNDSAIDDLIKGIL